MRITMNDLNNVVKRINIITNSPIEPYTKKENKYIANIGNYHLDGAYGGWALHRMQTIGGGIEDIINVGHVSKKELYMLMQAYIRGLQHEPRK